MLPKIKYVVDVFTKNETDVNENIVKELKEVKSYIDSVINIYDKNKSREYVQKILETYLEKNKITKKEFDELNDIKT